MGASWRTKEDQEAWAAFAASNKDTGVCPLCVAESTLLFTYWKIIPNTFPYSAVSVKHDMIVPLRHVKEHELTPEELAEFHTLKDGYINDNYQYLLESTHKNKSVPAHFHPHLLIGKQLW